MSDSDLHAIIADQAETIDQLRSMIVTQAEVLASLTNENIKIARAEVDDPYWSGVYDRIRSAWDAWAFAELGTASPSPLDLAGKPELADLWQAIK